MKRKNKITLLVVLALALVYGVGVSYFSDRAQANTTLNYKDVSFKSFDEIGQREWKNYSIEVVGRNDKNLTITPDMIDLDDQPAQIKSLGQSRWLWPISFFKSTEINHDFQVKINEDKLKDAIASSDLTKDQIAPENAKISYEDGKFLIEEEKLGDTIEVDKVAKSIHKAINNQSPAVVLDQEYVQPEVKKGDQGLNHRLEKASSIGNREYVYTFGDKKDVLTGDRLLKLYDEEQDGYTLNKDKVKDYVKQLSDRYDTYGKTHTFNATGIGEIEISNGNYGWLMDIDKTTDELFQAIEKGESKSMVPVYEHTAKVGGKSDVGDTYIELDLSRQTMWFYKDGELLVETPVVTGKVSVGYDTPPGVWQVVGMTRNKTLRGTDRVSGRDYASPVSYWIPFYGGYGIHDSSWRSSYGGNIYYYSGSHGCVNTPRSKVKVIYENCQVGTPVVIYWS